MNADMIRRHVLQRSLLRHWRRATCESRMDSGTDDEQSRTADDHALFTSFRKGFDSWHLWLTVYARNKVLFYLDSSSECLLVFRLANGLEASAYITNIFYNELRGDGDDTLFRRQKQRNTFRDSFGCKSGIEQGLFCRNGW